MGKDTKAKQKRVFEIAKELNISHIEIVKFLEKEGIHCTIMTAVDEATYLKILEEFAREKDIVERVRKERARREAESKRKAEEEARTAARKEQEKIEKEVFQEAFLLIDRALTAVFEFSADVKSELIRQFQEEDKHKDVLPEVVIAESVSQESAEVSVDEDTTDKKPKKKKEKEKKKEKRKLRRVAISEIEAKLDQKGKRRPSAEEEAKRKGRRNKRLDRIDDRKVDETIRRTMAKLDEKTTRKKYKKQDAKTEYSEEVRKIRVSEFTTVETLAGLIGVDPADVIGQCIKLGLFVTINQRLDFDTIILILDEFGYEAEQVEHFGEELLKLEETEEDLAQAMPRAPVVAVMGHVDHGKTSLLDYIRSTNVVAGESGGITQHVAAYRVNLKDKKAITFIDTPGHEAFTAMRARGAQVTDIVVIVVAADDGVMPQTIESINHAKAADVPIIIAINKIDKPEADTEKVKRGLSEQGILVEDWGGQVQAKEISAKLGTGVEQLLEQILLEAEMLELKANSKTLARGTVIESELDKRHGPMATILVQKGTLQIGDPFVCGAAFGRVRAMFDERERKVKIAKPSDPVVVVGFDVVPSLADVFSVVDDEKTARKIASERQKISREQQHRKAKEVTLDSISAQIAQGQVKQLNVVLKGDVDGSIEAINESFRDLGNEEVNVSVKHKAAGQISENDVLLAKASDAVIIGFNVSANPKVRELAKKENVELRFYDIIYELLDDVKLALEGMLSPEKVEEALGEVEVRAIFKIPKIGLVAGSYVTHGKVTRNARARVRRDDEVIAEGELISLRRFKDDVKEVQEGYECGIAITGFDDFQEGDKIEIFELKSIKRKLE
jgi:translation initiation factor IF-2